MSSRVIICRVIKENFPLTTTIRGLSRGFGVRESSRKVAPFWVWESSALTTFRVLGNKTWSQRPHPRKTGDKVDGLCRSSY